MSNALHRRLNSPKLVATGPSSGVSTSSTTDGTSSTTDNLRRSGRR
ncbi:MAG: hypothetical protein KIT69_08660 [Propionibacteriaceae bacterium]|nr:hypothetical protein [Propionibacteriaceae bacterium]